MAILNPLFFILNISYLYFFIGYILAKFHFLETSLIEIKIQEKKRKKKIILGNGKP